MMPTKVSRMRAGAVKDNTGKVEERLRVFNSDNFDADGYVNSKCQALSEKEIRQLRSYLLDLKRASAEEMRKSVYANYTAFIRTSKEISDLEGELSSIRKLLSTQASLIHGLVDGIKTDSSSVDECSVSVSSSNWNDGEPSDMEKRLLEFPDHLDVLLAERRVDESLEMLDECELVALEAKKRQDIRPELLNSLQNAIAYRRQKLADQLAYVSCQPSTRGTELRVAISALKKLGDGHRAHTLLLKSYFQRLQYHLQGLHPSQVCYGTYTASLSQIIFSAISQAVNDSSFIFGKEPAYTSELIMWATRQTEMFAQLVKRHVLALSTASGGLRAAAECVTIALGHCSLLEDRGLVLSPVLLRHFRPCAEQALKTHLKRIDETAAAFAAVDDWCIEYVSSCSRSSSSSMMQCKLSSSAHQFSLMVQTVVDDMGALVQSMQLGDELLTGVLQVFDSYASMLVRALPDSIEEEGEGEEEEGDLSHGRRRGIGVRMADSVAQQVTLLANALLLADELLPAAAKLKETEGAAESRRDWKKRLLTVFDRLRDSFCRQQALDLIYTQGDCNLTPDIYASLEASISEDTERFPSPVFQQLYLVANKVGGIAGEAFMGKDRFVTLLLMKLTETVLLWLSEDEAFWDNFSFGPLSLQQFYLDMKFVVCFASQGRYLSRKLHRIVNDTTARALNAFGSTGSDPYSVLPEDEWFMDVCQEAVERLGGKPKEISGELSSPTASVSAHSISSVRSHTSA